MSKRYLLILLVVSQALLAFDYKLEPVQVNSKTHCFFGYSEAINKKNNGNMSNSCFVNVGDSYIVIDSGATYQYAEQAYLKMLKIKKLPVSYVINTHTHDDHWLGNCYYETIGATLVGSTAFKDANIEEMPRVQKRVSKEAYAKTRQVHPTMFIQIKTKLLFKNASVELVNVNAKAHTQDDLYVYIPTLSTLFVGDLLFNDRLPSIRDGNLKFSIEILKKVKKLQAEYIIGGHGKITSRKAFDMTQNYLNELYYGVKKLIEEDYDIDEVVEILRMPKYANVHLYKKLHRQNVEIAYRMLEWDSE